MSEQSGGTIKTHLKGSWCAKMAVFFIVLVGLGIWGYVDAAMVYPARGKEFASFAQWKYLQSANESRMLFRASVEDPAAELARLSENELSTYSGMEQNRYVWLTALSRFSSLEEISAENKAEMERRVTDPSSAPVETATLMASPADTLKALETEWANKDQPKPLSGFDIPVQWLIMFAGIAGALWVAFLFIKAKATVFSYKPETHELTLPGGKSFTPDRITVVDKRKWDKFFVFLQVEGIQGEVKLDLLKFVPLEEWVLEMEKLSPNYEGDEEDSAGSGEGASEDAPAEHAQSA